MCGPPAYGEAVATVDCPKCGAPISFDVSTTLVRCGYCKSQVFIDRRGATLTYIYPFLVGADQAQGVFRRWAAGSRMAKDLETAAIRQFAPLYFPVYFLRRRLGPEEKVFLEPAKATTLPGLHGLKVPPGDMKVFDADFPVGGARMVPPEIGLDQYLAAMPGEAIEQALVYVPMYQVDYDYGGRAYSAVVEGSTGEVFASDYPRRRSGAYVAVAALGLLGSTGAWALVFLYPGLVLLGIAAVIGVAAAIGAVGYRVAKEH